MIELADPEQMRSWSRRTRATGESVGLVPTMGYFHEGHLRLIDRARQQTARTVVSVFVNPLQFGPHEDFERYPRDLEHDRNAALARGVDCLFVPEEAAMYPAAATIRVVPGALGNHLCGPRRPGHFEGVLTVVAKLLHIVEPDVAVFGRKDVQQAIIIKRMVTDLNLPAAVDIAPTVREADGLALSSRNAYLAPAERRVARMLARGLNAAHESFKRGMRDAQQLIAAIRAVTADQPAIEVEYIEIVDPKSLAPIAVPDEDSIVALAARIGDTRLIDNIILGEGTAADVLLDE